LVREEQRRLDGEPAPKVGLFSESKLRDAYPGKPTFQKSDQPNFFLIKIYIATPEFPFHLAKKQQP